MKSLAPLTEAQKKTIVQEYPKKPILVLHKEVNATYHQVREFISNNGVDKGRGTKPKLPFNERKVVVCCYVKRKHFNEVSKRMRQIEQEFAK